MKYRDEKDKCYGIVGMAIGLNIWDAEDLYTGIELDAKGFDCINFTYDYYFSGSPSISPKNSLQHQLKIFKIMMGITLSNVMCRSIVGNRSKMENSDKNKLLDIFSEQGNEDFALTTNECTAIFNKTYNYLFNLYTHSQVQNMVDDFAKVLHEKRRMTAYEVADALDLLNS